MIFEKKIVDAYKGMIYHRCDDKETVFYFSPEHFPTLIAVPHSFRATAGHTLSGCFYEYPNPTQGRIVVFDHGFGGGHLAYMKEIEMLCRHGYRVFAYDHTGCMASGGESPNGLAQSLCDLNDCISMLKSQKELSGCDISVMGHSWGGFSTLNITALHPDISHIVAMAAFVSVEEMTATLFPGILKGYRRPILALERESNPDFVDYNARETLEGSSTRALLIYSADDKLCRPRHYEILKEALDGKDNVSLMLVRGKGHNPNYTEEAVRLLGEFSKARAKLLRKKKVTAEEKARFVASFDWEVMTAQDAAVWDRIFKHLDT